MYVHFNKLTFKNINSYGNKLTTFNFENGLNLIAGSNGKGKCLDPNTEIEIEIDEITILNKFNKFNKNK